jgi:hypothetical protein
MLQNLVKMIGTRSSLLLPRLIAIAPVAAYQVVLAKQDSGFFEV